MNRAFVVAAGTDADYRRRDRVRVAQGVTILIVQFLAWLASSFIGFTLLLWPFVTGGITQAFTVAGGAMTTVGFTEPTNPIPPAIVSAAAMSGLVIIAPHIAYLPSLYAAYNRRETEVTLLNARSGILSRGPELLARTHYVLGLGISTMDTLPDLYAQWDGGPPTSPKATAHTAIGAVPLVTTADILGDHPACRAGLGGARRGSRIWQARLSRDEFGSACRPSGRARRRL